MAIYRELQVSETQMRTGGEEWVGDAAIATRNHPSLAARWWRKSTFLATTPQ